MTALRWTAIAALAALATGTAQAQTISIGTSPIGSLNNSVGSALGKVMNDVAGLRARVVPFGGGQQFLPLISKQQLEMAVPSASDTQFALQGKEDFVGTPSPNLRVIGTVFPFYIGWFVKKDAPYKSLADLKGKRLPIGFNASSSQRRIHLAGLASEGLKESDFDGVLVPHVVRGADDFMQGKVEGSTFAVGAGKLSEVDVKVGGIRFLNMTDTPESKARLQQIMPTAYPAQLQPSKELVGIVAPTTVLFEPYLVVGGSQMSDDDAYKIASVLYEHQDKLAGIARTYGRYNKAELARDVGVPYHPGAIKYYREKGIWHQK